MKDTSRKTFDIMSTKPALFTFRFGGCSPAAPSIGVQLICFHRWGKILAADRYD
jgi:hypothetical protein